MSHLAEHVRIVWWRSLHIVLPWPLLRRACSLCDEFPFDPRKPRSKDWEQFWNNSNSR